MSWEPRARLVLQAPESSPWPAPDPSLEAGVNLPPPPPPPWVTREPEGRLGPGRQAPSVMMAGRVRVPDAEDSAC